MKTPRSIAVFLLLLLVPLLFGCERHDPRVTRAFWDREFEHHLHEIGEVPDYARLYYPGALGPEILANHAKWEAYISAWRKAPLYMGVPNMDIRPSLDELLDETIFEAEIGHHAEEVLDHDGEAEVHVKDEAAGH